VDNLTEGCSLTEAIVLVNILFGGAHVRPSAITITDEQAATMDITESQEAAEKESVSIIEDPWMLEAMRQSMEDFLHSSKKAAEEMESLVNLVNQQDLVLANVPAAGNCLYEALCLALMVHNVKDRPGDHLICRRELVEHMQQWKSSDFDLSNKQTKSSYLNAQSKTGEWGDINVIVAASQRYRRIIEVISVAENSRFFDPTAGKRGKKPNKITLVLVNLNHYMFACPRSKIDLIPIANKTN
jgi:transcriptional regulator of acetoin/glycerol metabolism